MTETAVHVTTLEQWKSVLDVWFKNGYSWYSGDQKYRKSYFKEGVRELLLDNDNNILTLIQGEREPISYQDFVAQQKEDNKMETYYVTREQLDLIEDLKSDSLPLYNLVYSVTSAMKDLAQEIPNELDPKILRYIGGDESIEFKVKETLYRLWRFDNVDDKVYMTFNSFGTPSSSMYKNDAFTASLEEIKKWQTPSWSVEEVN